MASMTSMSRKDWLERISSRRSGTNSDSSPTTALSAMTSSFSSPAVRKVVDLSIGGAAGAGGGGGGGGAAGVGAAIERHQSSPAGGSGSFGTQDSTSGSGISRDQATKMFSDTVAQGEKELCVGFR